MPSRSQSDTRGRSDPQRQGANLASLTASPVQSVEGAAPLLPQLDLASDAPLPDLDKLPRPATTTPTVSSTGAFWLDGNALMCACPDCFAPMSVRLWLMLAECWRCGTIIELSQEQEREVLRLMQQREQSMRSQQQGASPKTRPGEPRNHARPQAADAAPAPAAAATPVAPVSQPQRDKASPRQQAPATPTVARERSAPVAPPQPQRRRPTPPAPTSPATTELSVIGTTGVWLREAFRDMPAWLVSLIFHLVAMTLLGLITFGDMLDRSIILSVMVSTDLRREGDDVSIKPSKEVVFDLPVPDKVDMQDTKVRESMVRADQDAKELRMDPNAVDPQLPDYNVVKNSIGKGGTAFSPLIARDPRVRVEMVKQEGGTTLTEAAVARGLRWLAKNQQRNGSWRLESLPYADGGQGGIVSDPAATSLALLPFLGAGQTHLVGQYKDTVSGGLRWLVQQQKPDGDLRGNSQGNAGMYAHGQCAIVLCEAYALTHDERFKEPAQKAIDFIVKAQHAGGGWRYDPGQAGDTSVVGWQLMALQSARYAKLNVPPEVMENASHYLDTVSYEGKSRYAYMREQRPTHIMTAEALLCRIYLGWQKDEPGLGKGVDWLLDDHLPRRSEPDIYYWYYGTQLMKQYGGREWDRWNLQMREVLVTTQETSGKNAGSWTVQGPHASPGGRIYMTSLATLTLEIYYRHLPVFNRVKID